MKLSADDRRLIEATQAGLPLVSKPYVHIANSLGMTPEWVQERLSQMLADGVIRRIGAVHNHFKLGFTANGMSVWDVADDQVDALGEQIGSLPGVSHCYKRPRYSGVWPYNLFAMLHGRSREEVEVQAQQLRQMLGGACRAHEILYSSRILKKTGLRLTSHSHRLLEES